MVNSWVRIGIANLDICILHEDFNAKSLVSTFDMVSSQAWLEPVKDGFEVKATDLFYELGKKKVLGFFENISRGSDHIARIAEKYPEWLPLNLAHPPPVNDGFDSVPF